MADEFSPIGKALVIPDNVISKIEKIDETINQIADDSENMARRFSSAIALMGTDAGELLKKLQSIQDIMGKIGTSKSGGLDNMASGMSKTATEAEKFSNSVIKAAIAINKYNTISDNDNARKQYIEKYKMYERMFDQIERNEKRAIQAAEREAQAAEKAAERQQKAMQRIYNEQAKQYQQQNLKANTTVSGALSFAESANTISQRTRAIQYLTQARAQLSTTDAQYTTKLQNLNAAIAKMNKLNSDAVKGAETLRKSHSNLINTSGQLARQLALLFSVSQITGYVNKLVRVRGEFELQNAALASILQNKEKADKLFGQITALAVQSPFTLKELTTYTKSLSAYSVEYEKLYDTTKMLADVSAGLGVDMQRLILAFGQVKAANFLRGTETRQFTEAGINMLGELAKYYSELEGRVVSVTEVMDRQFKRMISFQDVEAVFKRLTSAGGMFYNMQETQAETLAGMMSNLKDRIDLMLNTIGEENQGTIKGVIELLQTLIDNYEVLTNMIEAAGAAFVLYKLNVLAAKDSMMLLAIDFDVIKTKVPKTLSLFQLLAIGLKRLSVAIKTVATSFASFAKANVWVLAITAIIGGIMTLVHWNDEYNERMEELNRKSNSTISTLNNIARAYKDIADNARAAAKSQEDFAYSGEDYKKLFAQLSKLKTELEDRGYEMPIKMEFVTPQNIDEAYAQADKLLRDANDFATQFGKSLNEELTAAQLWGFIGENLNDDLEDLSNAYTNLGSAFKSNLSVIEQELDVLSPKLAGSAKEYYEELLKVRDTGKDDVQTLLQRLDLLNKINDATKIKITDAWGQSSYLSIFSDEFKLNKLIKTYKKILSQQNEVEYEVNKVTQDFIKQYGSIENIQKAFAKNPIVMSMEIRSKFDEIGGIDQATKDFATQIALQQLSIPVNFVVKNELPQFYGDFRDTVNTLDTRGIFKESLSSINSIYDFEKELQNKYAANQKELEALNRVNTQRLDLTKQIAEEQRKIDDAVTSQAEKEKAAVTLKNLQQQADTIDKTTAKRKEALKAEQQILEAIAKAFNLMLKASTGGGNRNPYLDELKEQISLLKKAQEEYKKLREYESEEGALAQTRELFKGTSVENIVATMTFDASGMIEGFKKLVNKAGKDGDKLLKEALRPFERELIIKPKIEGLEDIKKQIDEMLSGYDLYKEIEKLGLDKNIISSIFGIDAFSLDEVKQKLNKTFIDLANQRESDAAKSEGRIPKLYSDAEKAAESLGTKENEVYKNFLNKIGEQEKEELKNRLKTYAEYLAEAVDGRIKIEKDYQEEVANIRKTQGLGDKEKEFLITRTGKIRDENLASYDFRKFQESDLYVSAFEDLQRVGDYTLQTLLKRLEEFKDSAARNLPLEEFKEFMEIYKKIREEIENRNPWLSLIDGFKEWKEAVEEVSTAEERLEKVRNGAKIATGGYINSEGKFTLTYLTEEEEAINKVAEANNKLTAAKEKTVTAAKNIQSSYQSAASGVNELLSSFTELAEAFGAELSPETEAAIEGIGKGFEVVATVVGVLTTVLIAAAAAGTSLMTVLAPLLAIGAALGAVIAAFKIADAKRQRVIDTEQDKIEDLQRAYTKLQDAIDKGLSIDSYSKTNQLVGNLYKQIESYQKMIAAEQDKKNSNDDQIREWQNAIEDAFAEIENLFYDMKVNLVGDFKDVAQQLADALVQAFEEGTSAAEAWGDAVNDIIINILKTQLIEKVLEPRIQEVIDGMYADAKPKTAYAEKKKKEAEASLTQAYNMGLSTSDINLIERIYSGNYTASDIRNTDNISGQQAQAVFDYIKKYQEYIAALAEAEREAYNFTEDIIGKGVGALQGVIDYASTTPEYQLLESFINKNATDNMSGLQAGIEGITEETAQALEALLNSMRYYVADSNTQIKGIYTLLLNPPTENPFIKELRSQTILLSSIDTMLNAVIKTSSGKGKILRVEIV